MTIPVKTEELIKSLHEERVRFASWDNWRRAKTDIVLKAIKRNKKNADLESLEKSVIEVANEEDDLKELEESALKMLRIHYLSLSRTNDEKEDYLKRRERALKKLEEFKKKYDINNI